MTTAVQDLSMELPPFVRSTLGRGTPARVRYDSLVGPGHLPRDRAEARLERAWAQVAPAPVEESFGLADALGTRVGDRDRAERLGAAGRERARERYGMDRCVDGFERLYVQVTEGVPA